jgi:hypothetical protein
MLNDGRIRPARESMAGGEVWLIGRRRSAVEPTDTGHPSRCTSCDCRRPETPRSRGTACCERPVRRVRCYSNVKELDRQSHTLSRRDTPELCIRFLPPKSEGAGKAGCPVAPAVRVRKRMHAAEPQVWPDHPAFPARWFYCLYALSPVTTACLPPSSARCRSIIADLTPAWERQDHTISPSAPAAFVCCRDRVHRIPPRRS